MRGSDEENVSTEQPPPSEDARVSRPHEQQGGPSRAQEASGQGPQAVDADPLLVPSPEAKPAEPSQAVESRGFPKASRILNRAGFRRVYETGRKVQTRYFTAFVLSTDQSSFRVGLTATRRVGKSHERNRCRRLLREAVRCNLVLPGGPGVDVVLNVKREMVAAAYADVEAELIKLLARIRR